MLHKIKHLLANFCALIQFITRVLLGNLSDHCSYFAVEVVLYVVVRTARNVLRDLGPFVSVQLVSQDELLLL